MKVFATALIAALVTSACGSQDSSESKSLLNPAVVQSPWLSLQSAVGEVTEIKPANGQTEVALAFDLGCMNDLAPLTHKLVVDADGPATLYVSAFEKISDMGRFADCTNRQVRRLLILEGEFENLDAVFLRGKPQDLPKDLKVATPSQDIRVGQVRSLCPDNVVCITDGTVIDLDVTTLGCLDDAALSVKLVRGDDHLNIYASALNLNRKASDAVRCAKPNVERFPLSLVNEFYSADQIRLHVLN